MGGDPFTLVEQFDRTRGDPRLDRLAREAIRDRVIMALDLDMIIETSAPPPASASAWSAQVAPGDRSVRVCACLWPTEKKESKHQQVTTARDTR